jgi:hypothetical protein
MAESPCSNSDKTTRIPKLRRTESRLEPARANEIRTSPPRWMNFAECAAFLDKSVRTLREDVSQRRISCVRIGGRVLFRTADVERDLAKLTVPAL